MAAGLYHAADGLSAWATNAPAIPIAAASWSGSLNPAAEACPAADCRQQHCRHYRELLHAEFLLGSLINDHEREVSWMLLMQRTSSRAAQACYSEWTSD